MKLMITKKAEGMNNPVNELRELIKKTLTHVGFSTVIPLADREEQLSKVEKAIMFLWAILPLFFLQGIQKRFFWLVLSLPALFLEQVIDIILRLHQHHAKNRTLNGFSVNESLRRPFHNRFNRIFFFSYFIFSFIPQLFGVSSLLLYVMIAGFIAFLLMMEWFLKKRIYMGLFLGLFYELLRIKKQFASILDSGLGLVAPGILIAFIAATISRDLWEFVSGITWVQILILFALILLFVLGKTSSLRKALDEEVQNLDLEKNPYSPERLYAAIVRSLPYSEAKRIPRLLVDSYEDCYSWKWHKQIYDSALKDLIDEFNRLARWHFHLSLMILMPLTFAFTFFLSVYVFPGKILFQWTGVDTNFGVWKLIIDSILGNNLPLPTIDWGRISENPITKFSAISTLLLMASFVASYTEDGKRIFANLQLETETISDWLTLLCAYQLLKEQESQFIAYHWIIRNSILKPLSYSAPIYLVPNTADALLIENILTQQKSSNNLRLCAIFVKSNDFKNTIAALRLYSEPKKESREDKYPTPAESTACWVWMDKGKSDNGVHEFSDLDEAQLWISENSLGLGGS